MRCTLPVCSKGLFWRDFPNTRLVTLNREKALNALNLEMVREMSLAYFHEHHPKGDNALFVVKGMGEKSFCAGGDIVMITTDNSVVNEFFYREYQLNHRILTMPNPQVSLWNGYVMGGGVGISVHGRYRVASERAIFAMPENGIGLFPDVGASWFLPRLKLPGFGLYLGLTGGRVKGADLVHLGLATHYVPAASFEQLEDRLCHIEDSTKVDACLNEFAVKDLPPFTLEEHRPLIEKVFTLKDTSTVEDVMGSLAADGGEFARTAISTMEKLSPTSLKLALKMQQMGAKATDPAEVFSTDYVGAIRTHACGDFPEGVRALLIDKTKDPKWNPGKLSDVTPEHLAKFFEPLGPDMRKWHPTEPY
ncbi:enoyl-CoA hydratase/isomerase family protein [Trypanosoma brucei equiperdum]|uniref:3-hydroxyisobutyryl-CoA hydrolase n=1 Tax=Trypanosoma brucei equiperdum TaxID=630700 RepID=A0A3L6KXG0_9TRYP|nr:enoyl-CoA hydratase/isomerase family protein [Trypanosoma brucei equiperdum]